MLPTLTSGYMMLGAGLNDILGPLKDNWITPGILFVLGIVIVTMILKREHGKSVSFQEVIMFLIVVILGLAVYFSPGLIQSLSSDVGTSVEQGFGN